MDIKKENKNKKNLQVTKLGQTKCQNSSMSKIDRLKLVGRIFSY